MAGGHRGGMSWEAARSAATEAGSRLAGAAPGWARRVAPAAALGATLAEDVAAGIPLPSFDAAAMDGYAVSGPGPWTVVGRRLAGASGAPPRLRSGDAAEVATGAQVPEGTTAVLPYEEASREGDKVRGQTAEGRHVRRLGEDVGRGAVIARRGEVVGPALVGLACGLAADEFAVLAPPVAVLVTGDELADAGVPGPGLVRDAIGPLLPGVVAWAGGAARPPVRVPDDRGALRAAVEGACAPRGGTPLPAVVAVCGASSAGPADHLRSVLADMGARPLVDGVACRPGHPQLLADLTTGRRAGPLVVGLPGNPYAALVAALTLLVPALAAAAGRRDPALRPPRRAAEVRGVEPRDPARRETRLAAVRLEGDAAVAVGGDRPGSLYGAARADALAVLPPGWRGPQADLLWLPG